MKFLVDSALSPKLAEGLIRAGHDAVHLRDYGMQSSTHEEICAKAASGERVLMQISAICLPCGRTRNPP